MKKKISALKLTQAAMIAALAYIGFQFLRIIFTALFSSLKPLNLALCLSGGLFGRQRGFASDYSGRNILELIFQLFNI